MTSREELARLLEDATDSDVQTAAQVLKLALNWCEQIISPARMQRRGEALEAILALNDALQAREPFLSSLPLLGQLAVPGLRTEEAVRQAVSDIEQGAEQLNELRQKLARLEDAELVLRGQKRDRDGLQTRLKELQQLEVVAGEVKALQVQVEALEERLEVTELEDLLQRLDQSSAKVLTLTSSQLERVATRLKQRLLQADQKEQKLQEDLSQLQSAQQRWKDASDQLSQIQDVLRKYCDADEDIAGVVPGAQTAKALLDQAQELLATADQALVTALSANDEAATRNLEPINFAGTRVRV